MLTSRGINHRFTVQCISPNKQYTEAITMRKYNPARLEGKHKKHEGFWA